MKPEPTEIERLAEAVRVAGDVTEKAQAERDEAYARYQALDARAIETDAAYNAARMALRAYCETL